MLLRWVLRATRADLLAHAVPRGIGLGLVAVQLDVIVDWGKLATWVRDQPPVVLGAVFAAAAVVAALDARRLLAATLLRPRLAVLRRQPTPGGQWGPAAAALLVPVGLPMGGLAAMLYGAAPAWVGLWTLLAAAPALARAAGRWGWALGLTAAAGGIAGLAHASVSGPFLAVRSSPGCPWPGSRPAPGRTIGRTSHRDRCGGAPGQRGPRSSTETCWVLNLGISATSR